MSTERIGYVPGVFDLFHIGHLNVLRNAATLCDRLIAGVVSDENARLAKGVAPVIPVAERLEIVSAIRWVDEAVIEDTPTKLDMWEKLRFDVIIKGDDWKGSPKGDALEAEFAAVGVDVAYLPYTDRTSSSRLREVLQAIIVAQ